MPDSPAPSRPDRRAQILAAALAAFLAKGYGQTTIADIRAGSGATTGSIYHFFPGKAAIAEALLEDAIGGWSSLSAQSADAHGAIIGSVRGLLAWALANPAQFRFLDEIRLLAPLAPDLAPIARRLAAGQAQAEALYESYVARGHTRALPWPVAHALMLGPAYDFLRRVTATEPGAAPDPAAVDLLAGAAWEAVRAR